ncbi:MAG: zinc metallopeptidase [Granulosicoccaceae bacterium]
MFLIVGIASIGLSAIVSWWMKRTYAKWSSVPNKLGHTGESVARYILDTNNLQHVKMEISKGQLSDHYIPSQDLLRLSDSINNGKSIASIAVAAHEVGHAIQDGTEYSLLKLKAVLMPAAAMGNQFGVIGVIAGGMLGINLLVNLGLGMVFMGILIQLLTLPIEIDASKRALDELTRLNLVDESDYKGAKSMLTAAAFTYLASAATSSAYMAVFVSSMMRGRRLF